MIRGEHPSAFAIDALAIDALTDEEARETRAHLDGCAPCRSRVDRADELRRRFAARITPALDDARRRRRSWQRWLTVKLAVPTMALAAMILLILRVHTASPSTTVDDDLGIKGGPVFQVYALHDHKVFGVEDGAVLAPGDEIRFAVIPQRATYVLIASLDGAGQVTIYYPYDAERSASVLPRTRTELPGSIVLDDSPGPERLVALFSTAPILAADVKAKLRELGTSSRPLAIDGTQVSLTFEKSR